MSKVQSNNASSMQTLLDEMQKSLEVIYAGGDTQAIARQKEKNKLTPRERIVYLCDKGTSFTELGAFTGFNRYLKKR